MDNDDSNGQRRNLLSNSRVSEPEAQYKLNQSKENVSAETVELDRSGEVRQPMMLSPKSPVYNRFKYYSALRTGYEQLNPAEK